MSRLTLFFCSTVVVAVSSCARIGQITAGLGKLASEVVEELAADSAARPKIGDAAGRAFDRRLAEQSSAAADTGSELDATVPACAAQNYDDYFGRIFKVYSESVRGRDSSDGRLSRVLNGLVDEAAKGLVRACPEYTDRALKGDEAFQGSTTTERLMFLGLKRGEDWQVLRRELPAFRAWLQQMKDL